MTLAHAIEGLVLSGEARRRGMHDIADDGFRTAFRDLVAELTDPQLSMLEAAFRNERLRRARHERDGSDGER